ncbi:SDR family NAD(P)-dependent oxidoreductase [Aeromicrobium sp. UC242_57]|uniref:SDR family NAD(P)-dependent oxidoreductase n=1 Tax=Aeromicrobium sp. UC242_57 TaxID=3374624 RepID=UPI00379A0CB5
MSSIEELKGQLAVVTGAASGLGRGLCSKLGEQGARLVVADVEQKALDSLAADLRSKGVEVTTVLTDVSKRDEVDRLAAIAADIGPVDLLFNNAGVSEAPQPSSGLTEDDWAWVLGVNLMGIVHGTSAFLPAMIERNQGTIVNTASNSALGSVGFVAAYTASKHAIVGFSESVQYELWQRESAVKIVVSLPGAMSTRMADSARNRPAEAEGRKPSEAELAIMTAHISHGISGEQAAEIVLAGVSRGDFYVVTHPEDLDTATRRYEGLMTGRLAPPVAPIATE